MHPSSVDSTCHLYGWLPLLLLPTTTFLLVPAEWPRWLLMWLLSLAILLVFVAGVWASGRYAAALGRKDPGSIVIDEFAGQWLAIMPVALDWRYYVVAFVLFRFADITKPWPCRAAERAPGGLGIMLDDIVAGVYAGMLTLMIAVWLGLEPNLPSLFG